VRDAIRILLRPQVHILPARLTLELDSQLRHCGSPS
jgi:hypothetical protein